MKTKEMIIREKIWNNLGGPTKFLILQLSIALEYQTWNKKVLQYNPFT